MWWERNCKALYVLLKEESKTNIYNLFFIHLFVCFWFTSLTPLLNSPFLGGRIYVLIVIFMTPSEPSILV